MLPIYEPRTRSETGLRSDHMAAKDEAEKNNKLTGTINLTAQIELQ